MKFRSYLVDNNLATAQELDELDVLSKTAVEDAVKFALNSPEPSYESAFEDIFAD